MALCIIIISLLLYIYLLLSPSLNIVNLEELILKRQGEAGRGYKFFVLLQMEGLIGGSA